MTTIEERIRPWRAVAHNDEARRSWKAYAQSWEANINSFIELDPDRRSTGAGDRPLDAVPFAVKDNIAVESFGLTCGSRILEPIKAPYTATAVQKLLDAGAVVIGKTNLDEFGMGSSTQNPVFGSTVNPWNSEFVAGGSSGGSAAAVAAGIVPFALGSDTGGSIRQPASFCGVYGLKPTYGTVSRFGLVAYASSLEVVGVIAESIAVTETVFTTMRGRDPRDHSSVEHPGIPHTERSPVIGIPKECTEREIHPDVWRSYQATQKRLTEMGYPCREVSLQNLDYVVPAYYVIATAEASANLARFDGVRYGKRALQAENAEELMVRSRSAGFSEEVKLRILLGTYVLRSGFQDQYYLQAQKLRTAIHDDLTRVFDTVDLILMPVYPVPPFRLGEEGLDPFAQKLADVFTSVANLAGIPSLAFPATVENGLPVGMQLIAPAFGESRLFAVGGAYEAGYPRATPPGYSCSWSGPCT